MWLKEPLYSVLNLNFIWVESLLRGCWFVSTSDLFEFFFREFSVKELKLLSCNFRNTPSELYIIRNLSCGCLLLWTFFANTKEIVPTVTPWRKLRWYGAKSPVDATRTSTRIKIRATPANPRRWRWVGGQTI